MSRKPVTVTLTQKEANALWLAADTMRDEKDDYYRHGGGGAAEHGALMRALNKLRAAEHAAKESSE